MAKVRIKILVSGKLFFQAEGEEPCIYEVCCREECPKGFLKLPKMGKPGYCCIACSDLKGQTNQIKAILRQR